MEEETETPTSGKRRCSEEEKTRKLTSASRRHRQAEMAEGDAKGGDEAEATDIEEEEDVLLSEEEVDDDENQKPAPIFRPGVDAMNEDEELVCDPGAYDILHHFHLGWPCLSFDFLGNANDRPETAGPQTLYLVAGTQAHSSARSKNGLYTIRCSNVKGTWNAEYSSDDEEEEDEDDPILSHSCINSSAGFNCVRICPAMQNLVATWKDDSTVAVYDVAKHRNVLDNPTAFADNKDSPIFVYDGHSDEGFALAWNTSSQATPLEQAQFLSGSRDSSIRLFKPCQGGWSAECAFTAHTGSVEGVSWKRDDANMFASASCDQSIFVWDVRSPSQPAVKIQDAHEGDVNVVSFRPAEEMNQLLSGGDDGLLAVRDLRFPSELLVKNTFHKAPICAIDWNPLDACTFLAGCQDDSITIWDLSLEQEDVSPVVEGIDHFPQQFLFQHMGQSCLTAAMWHPNIPFLALSTAEDGFNVFRPENLSPKNLGI